MDQEYLDQHQKTPLNPDLVSQISFQKISKYKKCLFDFFLLMSNSWIKTNITRLRNISAYCGIGIKQLQFQSLVLLSTTKKSSSYYDSVIEGLLNYIRFDLCFINYSSQTSFNYFSLAIVFTMVLMFLLISFQLLKKRKIFIKVFLIIFASVIWTIENYLMIPLVIYSTVYIQHSWFLDDQYVEVYKRDLEFNRLLGIGFFLQLVFLYIIVLMNTVFNYTSAYSYEIAYSRAHSLVNLKQVSFLFFLSMVHIIVSKLYFLYVTIFVGIAMVYNYIHYMPYYSHFDNLVDSGLWMTLTTSSILSLINEFITGGIETVICLIILLPFIYFLLWTKLKQNFDRRSNLNEDSPYITELKIRKLCYMKNDIDEDAISQIRELFNDGTRKFIEFKLLFIWECNFELKYSPCSALPMMKLLKFVFSSKRPSFFKKPKVIFTSFPEIESEFFYYKLYKQIYESKNVKDFSLLKYLKNYTKSNNLDADACKKLIELIDTNLESSRYSSSHICQKCTEFFDSVQNKDSTLSKFQKKYNDESEYLSQYKNFKEQLFNSNDPNSVSQSDKRRESFIDKLMGFNSEEKIAKIILSASPEETGKIIYSNRNCLDLLGASSSAEVIGKNFTFLIPKPYDKNHVDILQKFLLFGNVTDFRVSHLIILDVEGYAIEVSLHLSIAFYAQMPYFVLDIVGKSPRECLILCNTNGEILAFSEELNTVINKENKFIEEILPGISEYFKKYPSNHLFFYDENNKHELLKRVEMPIFSQLFNILYLYEDQSTFKFNHEIHNIPIMLNTHNSIMIQTRTRDSEFNKVKKSSFVKKRSRASSTFITSSSGKVVDNSSKIEKIVYFSDYANRIAFFFIFLMILLLCAIEINYSDNQVLCNIMNGLAHIRFSLSQIALNVRSIDLIRHNENLYYDYQTYANLILTNSIDLKTNLSYLKYYDSIYPIRADLKNSFLQYTSYFDNKFSQKSLSLHQSLIEVNSAVTKLNSTNFSDIESLYSIYLNCFETIMKSLINSTYKASNNMINKNSEMVKFIQSLKSIIFIPAFFLIVSSVILIILLERINKVQWKKLSEISTSILLLVRSKTADRMMKIHQENNIFEAFVSRRASIHLKIWPKYALTTFVFIALIGAYYVIITIFVEEPLTFIIELKIKHRYWGGLCRTYLIYVFIWAREAFISETPYSYSALIKEYNPVASPNTKFTDLLNELKRIEQSILKETLTLESLKFDYFSYLDLLTKSSCTDNLIPNCQNSSLSFGIHSAFNKMSIDLNHLINSKYSSYSELEISLEQDLYNLTQALTNANKLHENISNYYYGLYTNVYIGFTSAFLVIVLAYYFVVQKICINQMKKKLLSVNQINLMFAEGDAQKNKNTTNSSKFT